MSGRIRWREIFSRLTGLSVPGFGASWNPTKSESERARLLINFLEDRRILYNDYELESPEGCIVSVNKIRDFLTTLLDADEGEEGFPAHLKAMRAACRAGPCRFSESCGLEEGCS